MFSRIGGLTVFVAVSAFAFSAQAADLPVKAPAHVPVSVGYNWTGFYAGVNLGGGWASGDSFITEPAGTGTVSMSWSGVLGGGQLGYNW